MMDTTILEAARQRKAQGNKGMIAATYKLTEIRAGFSTQSIE